MPTLDPPGLPKPIGSGPMGRANLPHQPAGSPQFPACLISRNGFNLRLVATPEQRSQVKQLIQRLYATRGYQTEFNNGGAIARHQVTLAVSSSQDQQLFGTVTVRQDCAEGLLADLLYRTEIDRFRQAGARVCEMSSLAVDPSYGSKEVLASLYHMAAIYARYHLRATDIFIEVNPRHVSFYRRMLGFVQVGEQRHCSRVQAPAVLLFLDLNHVDLQVHKWGGSRAPEERTLYPHFFSKQEETALVKRLFPHAERSCQA